MDQYLYLMPKIWFRDPRFHIAFQLFLRLFTRAVGMHPPTFPSVLIPPPGAGCGDGRRPRKNFPLLPKAITLLSSLLLFLLPIRCIHCFVRYMYHSRIYCAASFLLGGSVPESELGVGGKTIAASAPPPTPSFLSLVCRFSLRTNEFCKAIFPFTPPP